jgi:hypothetical protein
MHETSTVVASPDRINCNPAGDVTMIETSATAVSTPPVLPTVQDFKF